MIIPQQFLELMLPHTQICKHRLSLHLKTRKQGFGIVPTMAIGTQRLFDVDNAIDASIDIVDARIVG